MATVTVATEIVCPDCGKRMAKKNWKDHARHKHTMTEDTIQKKYEQLKSTSFDKPFSIAVHNFFSLKKFATTASTSDQEKIDQNIFNSQVMRINDQTNLVNNIDVDLTLEGDGMDSGDNTSVHTNIEDEDPNELNEKHILNDSHFLHNVQEIIATDNELSSNSNDNEIQVDYNQLSPTLQTSVNLTSDLLDNDIKSIKGITFINSHEISFIQIHRTKYPDIQWNPPDNCSSAKPSPTWFNNDHPWLRAVCKNKKYGLLCADCIEFASNEMAIKRNSGAFVVKPFWKLQHKGIEAIREHKKSDLHRTCVDRRHASRIVSTNGNVAGQLKCVNLNNQTRKYLSVLIQTLWKIIREELPLVKFKSLIEFLYDVECPGIVNWFKISNAKERYWSWEAIAEWLQSINKYIHHLQINSIKKTQYINIIMDETRDITTKNMLCLCLRYVEEDTGRIREEIFMLKPIKDTSGEGIFNVAQKFIEDLEKDANKKLIITAQTYDGASAMRYQAQGHIRSRMSTWAFYIYCRSHLLNLSVQDAIENLMYDVYDTVHSTLVFLRDSSNRLHLLFESQKLLDSKRKVQTIPKPSDTRWSYAYELVKYMCKHYIAIIITLTTISQYKTNDSSDGRRYALDLMKPDVVFQVHIMRDALRPSFKFLRQIEKRGSCLDEFAVHVDAARITIKESIETFDFNQIRIILNDIQQYLPSIQPTAQSTRSHFQPTSTNFDEGKFRDLGKHFINNFLLSLDNRFNAEAKQLIENIAMLSSPSKYSPEQLLQNSLILQYSNSMSYKHAGVDRQTYEHIDPSLLNYGELKNDVFSFLTIVGDCTSITTITQRLALHGSEQCCEWHKLYQILATFAVGSNEAERMFSTLRRIKSWLRNSLSDVTLEILVKMSALKIDLTDDAIKFIIEDFIKNPNRAKDRNVSLFIEHESETELIENVC